MRLSRSSVILTALLSIGLTSLAFAQNQKEGSKKRNQNQQSARQRTRQRFEQNSPKIGERLPDVSAYDADGNKINLRDLRGSYTILIFGCLT